jgi:hypothetical protein
MELDLLSAVAGGEDDHSLLRYHVWFVDITRTMTPMVSLFPIELNQITHGMIFSLFLQKVLFGSIARLMGGKTVQEPSSYAENLMEILKLATE